MIELFGDLALGLSVAVTAENLGLAFLGVLLGTLIGVLPGIGPVPTIALLLPITFALPPIGALIMLAGIFYGSQYGGSTTAILLNLPGEASSVVTCLDGHAMARNGRAGAALTVAALGSFFAGTVATLLIALASPPLAAVAQTLSSADYAALMLFGLTAAVVLASGPPIRAIGMVAVGLLLGLVGTDINTGEQRLTLGLAQLSDGISFVPLAMGLFGIAEILRNLEKPAERAFLTRIGSLMPTGPELRAAGPAVARGTALGAALGALPGGGALLASFGSYVLEKRIAREPSRFGQGAIEGVAGPEAANNAAAQTAFVPLLTLGIPSNAVMALLIGAMMIHGIVPGPQVIERQPELFWGVIASMWIGNLMLVVLNLPLIGLWVRLLAVPYRLLFPTILVLCSIGVFSLNNTVFDVWLTLVFGVVGYGLIRLRFEPAPLLLGFVLGPLLEENLRRAMLVARGDLAVFIERPVSAAFLAACVLLLVSVAIPAIRRSRKVAFQA